MSVIDLTPRQEEIRTDLLLVGADRPVFDRSLGARVRDEVAKTLHEFSAGMPERDRLYVNKHRLTAARSCEGLLVARDAETFAWNAATVRGRVTHLAMELLIVEPAAWHPSTAAVAALNSLAAGEDEGLAAFLTSLDPVTRSSLVGYITDVCTKFLADWPPIPPSWRPRVESAADRWYGHIKLSAKFDLLLGIPQGSTARTIIIDYKTGAEHDDHRQDLHFYALMETLRSGTPPYRVATYYLDAGSWQVDDITEDTVEAAMRMLFARIDTMLRVRRDGVGPLRPSGVCRFCPAARNCEPGQNWLARSGSD